jgi:hypothetical protein
VVWPQNMRRDRMDGLLEQQNGSKSCSNRLDSICNPQERTRR